MIVSCLNKEFIYDLNIMFIYCYRTGIGFCQLLPCKEYIVAKRLDLDIIVEIQDLLEFRISLKELSCDISVLTELL